MGSVGSDKLLLVFLVPPRPQLMLARGEVEEGAPAATPHPIMFFYHPLEVGPILFSEFPDSKSRRG